MVFDLATGETHATVPVPADLRVDSVALSAAPPARLALGVRSGGQVGVASWDVRGGNELGRASWPAPNLPGVPDCGTGRAFRLGFAAGGALAAVLHEADDEAGPPRCSLHVHDGRSGAGIAVIDLDRDPVSDWAFSADGRGAGRHAR